MNIASGMSIADLYPTIEIDFPYGTIRCARVSIFDMVVSLGYSKAETRRMFNQKAIKVWDYQVTPDRKHIVKDRREARFTELIEPDEEIYIGSKVPRLLKIKAKPIPLWKLCFYKLRDQWEYLISKYLSK